MLPGVPVHVIHRGNNRQACFFEDNDRSFYLFHLRRLLRKTACSLHAYCLMTNHVHLLLTAAADHGCSQLMQGVAQLHTQYVNRNYGRSGSLWEGRFRSCLVQSEQYLLGCYRYIEANPVRAALCRHPRDYAWSSYRANAEEDVDTAISPHGEYLRLGPSAAPRRKAYGELFQVDPRYWRMEEIREATNGNFALGDTGFKRRLALQLGRRVDRGSPGRPSKPDGRQDGQADLLDRSGKNVVCP
jgi:putative transposase